MPATFDQTCNHGTLASDAIVASLQGANKNYGTIRALRDIDFGVRAGEVVALLGPNGAGKTTAVKLLLGLMQPASGKVRVFGGDPVNPENRMRTGAMLQVGRVPETLRVRELGEIIAEGTPATIKAQTAGKRIRCITRLGISTARDSRGNRSEGRHQRIDSAPRLAGNFQDFLGRRIRGCHRDRLFCKT
jgi:ABC-type multidrug transport system ATPase subunit